MCGREQRSGRLQNIFMLISPYVNFSSSVTKKTSFVIHLLNPVVGERAPSPNILAIENRGTGYSVKVSRNISHVRSNIYVTVLFCLVNQQGNVVANLKTNEH